MKRIITTVLWLAVSTTALAAPPEGEPAQTESAIVSRYLLMDTAGNSVTDRDFAGRFQLIAFGYTYCPDICPTTLSEVSLILKRLGPLADKLQPIFITVDPERDTPEVLSKYTAFFHPRIIGLTGQPALIRRTADNFKVRYEKHFDPNGDPTRYSMDHSAGIYLLGPDGKFVTKFAYATPLSLVIDRIRTIIESTNM
jgi:protein SCO1/2